MKERREQSGNRRSINLSEASMTRENSFFGNRLLYNSKIIPYSFNNEKMKSINEIISESQVITLFKKLHHKLQDNQIITLKESQLDTIYNYCSQYSLQDNNTLFMISKEMPLTINLYQQILVGLRQRQLSDLQKFDENFNNTYQQYLNWFENCHISKIPNEPNFTGLSKSIDRQERLQILWKLTTKQFLRNIKDLDSVGELGKDEFANALNGLCHLTKPSQLIREVNRLIPYMNRKQIGIAQIIVYHLAHHRAEDFNDTATRNASRFCRKVNRRQKKLEKCGAYFGPEINQFIIQTQELHQSTLSKNINSLESWFQSNLKNRDQMSFKMLLESGIKASELFKDKFASEIARELSNAVSYYYQKIPLAELMSTGDRPFCNQFDKYTELFTNNLIKYLKALDDTNFISAIHLLVKVIPKLRTSSTNASITDLQSLMMLNIIFENAALSKRIASSKKLSEKDRALINWMKITLSVDNNFKELRKFESNCTEAIPFIGISYLDLLHTNDVKIDSSYKLSIQGMIVEKIFNIQRLLSRQTIFFTTNILQEMSGETNWSALKPELEEIKWQSQNSFDENITAIERAISNEKKVILNHKGQMLHQESINRILWEEYAQQIDPPNNMNDRKSDKMLKRLQDVTDLIVERTERERRQQGLELELAPINSVSKKKGMSTLERLSSFGSFRLEKQKSAKSNNTEDNFNERTSLR